MADKENVDVKGEAGSVPEQVRQTNETVVKQAKEEEKKNGKTVFDDPADFTLKHPLYATWQLWFDSASRQDKAKNWDDALVKIIEFDTVEEFWGVYNNVVPPSLIQANSNYYLFKSGIKPAWEDKANSQGGKWSIQLPRGKYTDRIDQLWLYTMLAAIGETLELGSDPSKVDEKALTEPPQEVTGVIVSSRKAFFRINVWTRHASPEYEQKIKAIGRALKYSILGFSEKLSIKENDKVSSDVEFVSHKDSQTKYGSKNGLKWTV